MPLAPGLVAQQIVRASAALAGAGAWDATPTELYISGADTVSLAFAYTRAGAGGSFGFQVQISLFSVAAAAPAGSAEWQDGSVYGVGAIAAGADTVSAVQAEQIVFQATAAGQEAFAFQLQGLGGTVERIRIPCHEVGAVGTPGTLQATLVAQ